MYGPVNWILVCGVYGVYETLLVILIHIVYVGRVKISQNDVL